MSADQIMGQQPLGNPTGDPSPSLGIPTEEEVHALWSELMDRAERYNTSLDWRAAHMIARLARLL